MNLVVRAIVHNWPLKLGAIVLASLLYAGLVLSQTARSLDTASVPIVAENQPSNVVLLSDLGVVTRIRYIVPEGLGLRIDSSTFRATVNLANVDPAVRNVTLVVTVTPTDERVQVLEHSPRTITVSIDRLAERTVPVKAVLVDVPDGLEVGDPVTDTTDVEIRGPEAVVSRVVEAQARVRVDASGIDVDSVVDLLPVDAAGEVLRPVDVEPQQARVRVAVFTDRRTRAVPVNPVVTGTPAAGFEVTGITFQPLVVTVEGDANDLAGLERADTEAISVTSASSDVTQTVGYALPDGVVPVGSGTVRVTVTIRPETSSRTFEAGLALANARADRVYQLSTTRVLVVIAGSVADLDRLAGAALVLTLDVAGLDVGAHAVAPQANLTTGLTLVTVNPSPVTVTISLPAASPAPSSTP